MVSGWLDVLARATHTDKSYWLPDVDDQVAVILDEREEAGCVVGAVYSSADPVPAGAGPNKRILRFGDGGVVEYDRAAHVLKVTVPDGGKMQLIGDIELAGNASAIALASKVADELQGIKDALTSHTHQAGTLLLAPPGAGGGPCTGVTGAPPAISYNPSSVAAAKVKSA